MLRSICLTWLMLLSCAAGALCHGAEERPNFLFLYTDDQAPTAVGHLNPDLKTPHIDRLFREGARLANAFVTTPVCSPSRASLMTGRYASELGIDDWINPRTQPDLGLDPTFVTWPQLLTWAGYNTGLVGKWHLGTDDRYHPTRFGFSSFIGFRAGGAKPFDPVLEQNGTEREFKGYTTDILTDHAIAFLHATNETPFALSLHFRAPHSPWLPVRDEDWAPYADLEAVMPHPHIPDLNVPKIRRMTREYYASVSSVDRNIGRLLDTLDELNLTEKTVVVLTSDHGYHVGHHGLWFKGNAHWQLTEAPEKRWDNIPKGRRPNLYDQALRVATAVRWPGTIESGQVITQTITNLDWFPTLLDIARVEVPNDLTQRGTSFWPLLQGKTPPWDNTLYAEYNMRHGAKTDMRAWRTPEWKYVVDYRHAGREELYNLRDDPEELTNLALSDDTTAQTVRKEYATRIEQMMESIGSEFVR